MIICKLNHNEKSLIKDKDFITKPEALAVLKVRVGTIRNTWIKALKGDGMDYNNLPAKTRIAMISFGFQLDMSNVMSTKGIKAWPLFMESIRNASKHPFNSNEQKDFLLEAQENMLFNTNKNPFEDDEEEKKRIQAQLRNVGTRVQAGTKSDEINSNFAVDIDAESSFGDLWQAQIGYQYDPILESAYRWHKYRNAEQDPNFNALSSMDGYEGHESSLVVARNQEEEDDIKRAIDENRDRRATMSEFGFGANLVAGILDPINLLAVPFAGAGFVTAGARSMGGLIARRGLATGAGVGITQVGLEAIRAPFDPENTEGEVLLNVGMATIAGTIIGGAVSIPAARRMNVTAKTIIHQQQVKKALDETILDDLDTLDAGDGINKAKRKHGAETKETLNAANEILPKKMEKLKSRINER